MWGPPEDVKGECNARMELGDDYGDNCCTMRCGEEPGHDGPHTEKFSRSDVGDVIVTWERDGSDPR